MSWTWWNFVSFSAGVFALGAFVSAIVLILGREGVVGVHFSGRGKRRVILGNFAVGIACVWFSFDPPGFRPFYFVLIGYTYGVVLLICLVRSMLKKTNEDKELEAEGATHSEENADASWEEPAGFWIVVTLTGVLSVASLFFAYEEGPPEFYWLARLPWAICLVLTGLLYWRKRWWIIPLLLTVFIAFPELFLSLRESIGSGVR
ncbi:hypothetical protein [Pseudodesulfovibrio sp.]|uniref:hypothetical protein n=1 Tax=unclassified Pseudodesulfovibrio TaxID=2661612 RepID=UPI003B0080E3